MQMSLSKKSALFVFLMSISVFIIANYLQPTLSSLKPVWCDEVYTSTNLTPDVHFQILPDPQFMIPTVPFFRLENDNAHLIGIKSENMGVPGSSEIMIQTTGNQTSISW